MRCMETGSKMLFSDDPSDFVSVKEVVSDAILDIRYYSANNFIGDRVDGYEQEVALLTKEAAAALKKAGEEIRNRGLCFKIYDAYRPQIEFDPVRIYSPDSFLLSTETLTASHIFGAICHSSITGNSHTAYDRL